MWAEFGTVYKSDLAVIQKAPVKAPAVSPMLNAYTFNKRGSKASVSITHQYRLLGQ